MIRWEEWGEAAFARAKSENRPILLVIGATWCHWCHVMDDTTWSHPRVAELVNERFVPIRIDTDLRPEVNDRYNQGGWPSVAVLDASGEVLVGRTYVPAQELLYLLMSVSEPGHRWSIAPSEPEAVPTEVPSFDALDAKVRKAYDRYHGGFGDFQKFPHVGVLEWLLDRRLRGGDTAMLDKTLAAMADGGLWDKERGGFFRYATADDWSEPHYEKLLEDNARLLHLYLRVAEVERRFRGTAEGLVRWAVGTLWQDAAGAFGASQDADGRWYTAPPSERGEPPAVDPTIVSGWNGLMLAALVRAAAAWDRPGLLGLARMAGEHLLERSHEGRISRVAGGVSGLLSDQAETALGWLLLWQRTGESRWRDAAGAALAWARDHLAADGGGYWDAVPDGPGLLRIGRRAMPANTAFAEAAWRYGALIGDASWLDVARSAANAALAEGEPWGFAAANAASIAERLTRPAVVVKCWQAPALRDATLADAHLEVLALELDATAAEKAGVAPGTAMACTARACARPSRDLEALRRAIRDLQG